MSKRLPNPRRAKMHRSYTVEEVARLYDAHRNTVRQWIKAGLPVCDDQRPLVILGSELRLFLTQKRMVNKRPCQPGEIYCVRCRAARTPALDMADYAPLTATSGNMVGMCPACEAMMFRRVSLAKLEVVRGNLVIRYMQAKSHISDSSKSSVNCDFKAGA